MKEDKVTIGILSRKNPMTDAREWSGTIFTAQLCMKMAGFDTKWIKYRPNRFRWVIYNLSTRLFHGLHCKTKYTKGYGKLCADSINKDDLKDCDILFLPSSVNIRQYLNVSIPSVYLTDATYFLLDKYYYSSRGDYNLRSCMEEDLATYQANDVLIVSSEWAKNSMINDYSINPEKIRVLKFGANIKEEFISHQVRTWTKGQELRILFSGVTWIRKGGAIAIEAVRELRGMGINAHLYIAGIKEFPQEYQNIDFVTDVGRLSKNIPEQYEKYLDLFRQCHLFLLPTRAECAGIVFCEASAFGLPCFTYDTGGIPDYVQNGVNGYRLPLSASPKDFARSIYNVLDSGELPKLSKNAIDLYKKELNWRKWGEGFAKIVNDLLHDLNSTNPN